MVTIARKESQNNNSQMILEKKALIIDREIDEINKSATEEK